VPQNRPHIAPPFQQAQDDVFGSGPIPGAQAFLVNLNLYRQFKYSGHCWNFARDTAVFHKKLLLLPEECDVIIMRRTGLNPATDEAVY
jgi:hypothetical protein